MLKQLLCFLNIDQNATECLAAFVSGGREEVLTWGGDSRFTMRSLLDAASRLVFSSLLCFTVPLGSLKALT